MTDLPHHTTPRDKDGNLIPAFALLAPEAIWFPWRGVSRPNRKSGKAPVRPDTGRGSDWDKPGAAVTYDAATHYALEHGLPGVGIVLSARTRELGLVGIDLDGAIGPDRKPLPWATTILKASGALESYVERSPSGKGFHVLALGNGESIGYDCEVYDGTSNRFLTVTGDSLPSWPHTIETADATVTAALARAKANPKVVSQDGAASQGGAVAQGPVTPLGAVNAMAMSALEIWVPQRFPGARKSANGVWRVSPEGLGRDTEEDLSIAPAGITDFGLADHPDETRAGKRSPVDCYMAPYTEESDVMRAAAALASDLGLADVLRPVLRDASASFGSVEPVNVLAEDGASSAAPRWPIGTLPAPIEVHARQVGGYLGANGDAACLVFLAAVAAALPSHVRYDVHGNERFMVGANLFFALVGDPGGGKSPLLRAALKPIEAADLRWSKAHDAERKRVDRANKAAAIEHKANKLPGKPNVIPLRPQRRKIVNNTTLEALVKILDPNPAGVVMAPDELSSWLGSIDRYNNGSKGGSQDTAFWLMAADAAPYSYDRVTGDRNIYIQRAHVTIYGGIQPTVLRDTLGKLTGDGLLQRFIFARLKDRTEPDRSPLDDTAKAVYEEAVASLLDVRLSRGEDIIVRADADAAAVNMRVEAWTRGKVNDRRVPLPLKGFYAKLPGLHGRLTLLLCCLDWAAAEAERDPCGLDEEGVAAPFPDTAAGQIAERAWRLIADYIEPTALTVYATLGAESEDREDVALLLRFVLDLPEAERESFTARDAGQKVFRFKYAKGWPALDYAAAALEKAGWLIRDDARPGRTAWRINAEIYDGRFDRGGAN